MHLSGASTNHSTQCFVPHESSFAPYYEIRRVQGIGLASAHSRQLPAVGIAELSGSLRSGIAADPSSAPSAIAFLMSAEAVKSTDSDDEEAKPTRNLAPSVVEGVV